MSFAKTIVQKIEVRNKPIEQRRKKRQHRIDNRFESFASKRYEVQQWNTHDLLTYYQLVFRAKFGYIPPIRIQKDSGLMSRFSHYFMRGNMMDLEDVKFAIQLYFTLTDQAPESLGFMVNTRSVVRIRESGDQPLSPKVSDEKVFRYLDKYEYAEM